MRETYQPPTTPAGPPHDRTPEETAPLSPSTEIDTIRQSPTNHNENSRARQRRSVSLSPDMDRIRRIP